MQKAIDPADARPARPFSIRFPSAERDLLIAALRLADLSVGASFTYDYGYDFDYVYAETEREPARRGGK